MPFPSPNKHDCGDCPHFDGKEFGCLMDKESPVTCGENKHITQDASDSQR